MPIIRYLLILALLYILFRLIKATIRELLINLGGRRQHGKTENNNVHGGKKAGIDDIPDAKYEEIKDDTESRKN